MAEQGENRAPEFEENQWGPGQSGNPAGRPKGARDGVRAKLRRRLTQHPEGVTGDVLKLLDIDPKDKDNADVVVDMLLYKVARGDMQALRLIFDQTEEPLKQTVEQVGDMTFTVKVPERPDADDRPEQTAGGD